MKQNTKKNEKSLLPVEMEEMMLYNRFITTVNKLNLSVSKINEDIPGFGIEYINKVIMGNEVLSLVFFKKFCLQYKINANYIFTGKGDIHYEEEKEEGNITSPKDRLIYICQNENLNIKEFAKEINKTTPLLYDIKKGRIKSISDSMANAIVKRYPQYNYTWVKSGVGDIKKSSTFNTRDIKIDNMLSFYPILLQTLDNIEARINKLEELSRKNLKKNTA